MHGNLKWRRFVSNSNFQEIIRETSCIFLYVMQMNQLLCIQPFLSIKISINHHINHHQTHKSWWKEKCLVICMHQEEQQDLSWFYGKWSFMRNLHFTTDSHFHKPSSALILQEEITQTNWWRSWQKKDMHSQQQTRQRHQGDARRSLGVIMENLARKC